MDSCIFIGYGAFATAANFFKFNIVRYSILIGIPAIIILAIVYNHRKEKTEIKRFYLKSVADKKMILIKEIRYMLTFPDFLAEILSFTTIVLPFIIAIGVGNQAPWWANVFAGTILLCIFVVIFSVLDFILWEVVHIKWRKDYKI